MSGNLSANRSCGSYGPGHLMHWIQAKKSHEPRQPVPKVRVTAVHDDGRVEIDGDGGALTLWHHRSADLRSALRIGGLAEWKPKYRVLYVVSSGSFNLEVPDKAKRCKPPIRRRPDETTGQFIERAVRANRGFTVPTRWMADPDAVPRQRLRRTGGLRPADN